MPELSFVLPHWMYWGGLLLFPVVTSLIYRYRPRDDSAGRRVSLTVAYFLLLTGGFLGVHRLYLKSRLALVFIALFVGILVLNVEVREARDLVSGAKNDITLAELGIQRAQKAIRKGRRGAEAKLEQAGERLSSARASQAEVLASSARWITTVQLLAWVTLILMLADAVRMPTLVARRNEAEAYVPETGAFHCPAVEEEHVDEREPFLFNRLVSRLNGVAGELVAYWSVLAVFIYYYEVIARYVFNSPTNWAHEAMFLMFGMQYLLAGGFVLREGAHVRVDVLYMRLSTRAKAVVDLATSIFFFIFVLTLMVTGWTFFMDSYEVREVSFTEWAIQYWPVKFALPLGAALLLLQGIAQLLKDVAAVVHPDAIELDTEVRPEG